MTQSRSLPEPYPISFHSNSGAYLFQTDQSLLYSCLFTELTSYFSPVLGIYDVKVHDFQFYPFDPEPEKRKTQDPRVLPTVLYAVNQYFTDPLNVLIYFCDTSDGKDKPRHALFKNLHEKHLADTIHRDGLEIRFGDNMEARGGILYRKDFPHKDVLQTELKDKVPDILAQKFGQ